MVTAATKLKKTLAPWKKSHDKPREHIKKQRHHIANKGPQSQSYGFSSSHAQIWELDHKEGWEWKNWCFQIVALEKTLENPLDSTKIKPVNPEGNQPWIFTGRMDAEAPILWPPDVIKLTHWKRPWCWERLKAKEDRGQQRMRWLDNITDSTDMSVSQLQEIVKDRKAWRTIVPKILTEILKKQTT